jgi:two-component system cell cycle response regulator
MTADNKTTRFLEESPMSARMLVIEDNQDNLDLMVYLLGASGYTLLTADDGDEGVETARRESPDLIICDIHLPTVSGHEVLRQLKGQPALSQIPLVAVTALAMVGDRDKLLSAGFDGYIAKPIDPETFVAEVEAFLPPHKIASPPRRAAYSSAVEAVPGPAKIATVLVVDDSRINRELIHSTLQPMGYEVILAPNVREGLALARQHCPDLILSDLHMPDEDGFDFLKAIKADPRLNAYPFVFISSSVWGDKDKITALALGATRFIKRPIEPQSLLTEVAECLKNRKGE